MTAFGPVVNLASRVTNGVVGFNAEVSATIRGIYSASEITIEADQLDINASLSASENGFPGVVVQ